MNNHKISSLKYHINNEYSNKHLYEKFIFKTIKNRRKNYSVIYVTLNKLNDINIP